MDYGVHIRKRIVVRFPAESLSIRIIIDGYIVSRYSDAVQEQKHDPTHVRQGREPPPRVAGILYLEGISTEDKGAHACELECRVCTRDYKPMIRNLNLRGHVQSFKYVLEIIPLLTQLCDSSLTFGRVAVP